MAFVIGLVRLEFLHLPLESFDPLEDTRVACINLRGDDSHLADLSDLNSRQPDGSPRLKPPDVRQVRENFLVICEQVDPPALLENQGGENHQSDGDKNANFHFGQRELISLRHGLPSSGLQVLISSRTRLFHKTTDVRFFRTDELLQGAFEQNLAVVQHHEIDVKKAEVFV